MSAPLPPIAFGGRDVNAAIVELAKTPRWVCWKLEQNKAGKPTKPPYQVGGRRKADSTKPETWDHFDPCWTSAFVDGDATGIGIVLDGSDGLMAADLDQCIREDGTLEPWSVEVVRRLGSYTERSPSGTGLRVFFRSTMADEGRKIRYQGGHLELYRAKRFLTVTGDHLEGTPDTIQPVTPGSIMALLGSPAANGASNDDRDPAPAPEICAKLRARLNQAMAKDPRLRAAWNGEVPEGSDQTRSAFDLKLAGALRRHGGFTLEDFATLSRWWQHGKGADGDGRHWRRTWNQAEPESTGDARLDLSHDGLALGLGQDWQDEARHVALWGRWLFWTGSRWGPDDRLIHMTRTRAYLRARADSLVRAAAQGKIRDFSVDLAEVLAKQLRSAPMVANVVGLARSNEELIATVDQWDADPFLLGTPAGTVDLRTGELRPARQADFITKCTTVAPTPSKATAPMWQAFLERIFRHDPELIPFMQRSLGYALTGEVSAHVLLFCWGQGANGKGTLLNTVSRLLGDYAAVAPPDLLLVAQSDRHPCDMAMLRGARLVTAQELAPGRAWDEPKLKSLTGGDPITARFMRQDFFTYEPQFALFVAGNHKPSFKSVDEAIKRRVLLVPFLQVIPKAERNERLPEKLQAEWPAILRWCIDGCLAWQRQGLAPPKSALEATKDYLEAEDTLGQWLAERCIAHPKVGWSPLTALYADWERWAFAHGLHPGSSTALGKKLDERGFQRHAKAQGTGFFGLGLIPIPPDSGDRGESGEPPIISRNDPLGARAPTREYGQYGAHHHFHHSHQPDEPEPWQSDPAEAHNWREEDD